MDVFFNGTVITMSNIGTETTELYRSVVPSSVKVVTDDVSSFLMEDLNNTYDSINVVNGVAILTSKGETTYVKEFDTLVDQGEKYSVTCLDIPWNLNYRITDMSWFPKSVLLLDAIRGFTEHNLSGRISVHGVIRVGKMNDLTGTRAVLYPYALGHLSTSRSLSESQAQEETEKSRASFEVNLFSKDGVVTKGYQHMAIIDASVNVERVFMHYPSFISSSGLNDKVIYKLVIASDNDLISSPIDLLLSGMDPLASGTINVFDGHKAFIEYDEEARDLVSIKSEVSINSKNVSIKSVGTISQECVGTMVEIVYPSKVNNMDYVSYTWDTEGSMSIEGTMLHFVFETTSTHIESTLSITYEPKAISVVVN